MSWSTGLFELHKAKHPGVLCCFNHLCCGPCVWGDALKMANVANSERYVTGAIVGSALGTSRNDLVSAIGTTSSTFSSVAGRTALADKYGIEETTFSLYCARLCCPLCAQVQEVNTVIERENLTYGVAKLVRPDPAPPVSRVMKRSAVTGRRV